MLCLHPHRRQAYLGLHLYKQQWSSTIGKTFQQSTWQEQQEQEQLQQYHQKSLQH
jgi:hypothetical protein